MPFVMHSYKSIHFSLSRSFLINTIQAETNNE